MIQSLTPAQEARLIEYGAEKDRIVKNTSPINREKVESIINQFYTSKNRPVPKILYFDSPIQAIETLRKDHPDEEFDIADFTTYSDLIGSCLMHEFQMELGCAFDEPTTNDIKLYAQVIREMSMWAPYDNAAVVIERPIVYELNNEYLFHCETGPAIVWKDGNKMFFLNGVSVPEYLVMTPSENLDIEWCNAQENNKVKQEFVKKFGQERLAALGVTIDVDHQLADAAV